MEILKELWRDESGATAVEYALIAGFMAAAIVFAITQSDFQNKLKSLFASISDQLDSAATHSAPTHNNH